MSRALDTARKRGPRFAIVPPAAAFDARLEAIDVRVLLVFGAHIDRQGWCERSQVKMAQQLGVGRATLQRAIRRLCDAGYLQQERLTKDNGGDRAHRYRVWFDAESAPDDEMMDEPQDGSEAGDGDDADPCPPAGAPAHQRAGGAHAIERAGGAHAIERAPIRTTLPERPFQNEGEREARANEELEGQDADDARDGFVAIWPTGAVDNPALIERGWSALSAVDRLLAVAGVPGVLAALKSAGRRHVPSAGTYLRDRMWERVAAVEAKAVKAKSESASTTCPPLSKLWWGLLVRRCETGGNVRLMIDLATGGTSSVARAGELTQDALDALKAYPVHGPEIERWRPWFEARGARLPAWRDAKDFWVFLPDHAPPGWSAADEDGEDLAAAMGGR